MRYESKIKLLKIDRDLNRDGLDDKFHLAIYEMISGGIPPSEIKAWIHNAYDKDDIEKVAFTFLWSRLKDWFELAEKNLTANHRFKNMESIER
ncbi:MAG: hypothetical protein AAGC64_12875 [Bacteroidota bacterium]